MILAGFLVGRCPAPRQKGSALLDLPPLCPGHAPHDSLCPLETIHWARQGLGPGGKSGQSGERTTAPRSVGRKKFGRGCTRMYADKGEWTHGPCHRSGTSACIHGYPRPKYLSLNRARRPEVFPPKERKNTSRDDAVRLCVILPIVLKSVFTKRGP